MTPTELSLFKELIKECVRDVVKEELGKLNEKIAKDIKEVKILTAGLIKESRKGSFKRVVSENEDTDDSLSQNKKNGLVDLLNRTNNVQRTKPLVNQPVKQKNPIMDVLEATARGMTGMDVRAVGEVGPVSEGFIPADDNSEVVSMPYNNDPDLEGFEPDDDFSGGRMPDFDSVINTIKK